MAVFGESGAVLLIQGLGLVALAVWMALPAEATGGESPVAVMVGAQAPPLEHYAAEQLCGYLENLFNLRVRPTRMEEERPLIPTSAQALFLIGSLATHPARAGQPFPPLTDQGFVLRRTRFQDRPALVIAGGSPAATLWAVYELAERWGVRYLLHGDVLPRRRERIGGASGWGSLIPAVDLVKEPLLRVRQWRVINDFALGPESWGMRDYRPVIDQLAKLRFNRLFVNIYPYQPFLHLEVRGIQRRQAHLWYNFHYPITDDMVGRELFGDAEEFWNPDLPLHASYEELVAAGQRHVHELMAYARSRGMQIVMNATLTEFPPEFAPLLPGAQRVHQLGEMGVVPGPETDVDDPALTELAAAVLRTTVDTYPEVDFISLGMPEFRQWSGRYERAWQVLDAKYGLEEVCPLAQVMAAAKRRTGYPGGAERALQEVQGDIVALYFFDRLLTELKVLQDSRRPDVKFIVNSVAEELFPVLGRLLPPGSEALNFVDYTPARIVQRREVLRNVPSREIPCSLIYTLHDDNVGVLPQLTTGSLHELTMDLRRYGWAGFSTRYWLIGDHDPCVAYLSRASWEETATPEAVYRDQIRAACGEACVEDLLTVFREVEATTLGLEWHGLGLTFPVPGMMMKHWTPGTLPPELAEDRQGYRRALTAAKRARRKASPSGRSYVDYWVGRLEFGIGYLDTIEAVRQAATAEAERDPAALPLAEKALETARQALAAYARVARDQSDRGALAILNEYVYRPLQAKVAELKGKTP